MAEREGVEHELGEVWEELRVTALHLGPAKGYVKSKKKWENPNKNILDLVTQMAHESEVLERLHKTLEHTEKKLAGVECELGHETEVEGLKADLQEEKKLKEDAEELAQAPQEKL